MTAARDAIYDASTDEEGESLPDPSESAPGKIHLFPVLNISLGLITLMMISHNGKSYEKKFFHKKFLRVFSVKPQTLNVKNEHLL